MELSPDLVDDPMFEYIARVVDCLRSELAAANGPALCFCGLWPGDQPPPLGIMNCDKAACGIAWVSLMAAYPSSAFPLPDDGTRHAKVRAVCNAPMAYQLDIGVARCSPRATGQNLLPDEQDTFNAMRLYMSDQRAVRRAIACCFSDTIKRINAETGGNLEVRSLVGDWRPLPNLGGASGGIWKVWLGQPE